MLWRESPSFGGYGGWPFYDDFVSITGLVGLVIRHGRYVEGIQGIYADDAGNRLYGSWHGGLGGERVIIMFDEGELIENVFGRSGWFVDQIALRTNRRIYGPFGGTGGRNWEIGPGRYVIGALFGRAGDYLDRIGFCFAD
jgi:hypothetical protein